MTDVRQCCCSFGREFKSFALQGNILDLAIGIIIGTAFQNVVKSLVDDIITPPFGLIFDGVDFSNLTIKMKNFVHLNQPPVVIRYGLFIQQIIHLLVLAFAMFLIIKLANKLRTIALQNQNRQLEDDSIEDNNQPEQINEEILLLRQIKDLLVQINQQSHVNQTTDNNLIHL